MHKRFDLKGKKFGLLTVIRMAVKGEYVEDGFKARRWLVKCDCGLQSVKMGFNFKNREVVMCSRMCKLKPPVGNRLSWGDAAKNLAYSQMKGDVSNRTVGTKLEWNLSRDQFISITSKSCHYCGIPYSKEMGKSKNTNIYGFYEYNGIDRIDSSKGYVLGNCVPCCKYCNFAKNDQTQSEFREHLIRMYNHFVVEKNYALS